MDERVPELVKRMQRALQRRGVRDHEWNDIIQDAFHRFEIYRRERHVENVPGFLVRTVINLSIDASRRARRANLADEPVENYVIVDDTPRPDEVYAARKRLERLNDGFAELDPITRQMIRAQRMEGMSVAAIAAQHAVSVSAVEKRLAKGLAFLVKWMEEW